MDNRHDLIDRSAGLPAKPNQPILFLDREGQAAREPAAKQPVLDGQVADLAGQFLLSGPDQDQQQAPIYVLHVIPCKSWCASKMTSFMHSGSPAVSGPASETFPVARSRAA
jgi:hypothetical protein